MCKVCEEGLAKLMEEEDRLLFAADAVSSVAEDTFRDATAPFPGARVSRLCGVVCLGGPVDECDRLFKERGLAREVLMELSAVLEPMNVDGS